MAEISAGAITYTVKDEEVLYLLIRDFHGNWGFPKGHLEEGESEEEAAVREISEEAGIAIQLDSSFKEELRYVMPNGILKISIYFLGEYEDQTPIRQPEEVDEIRLLPYDEAVDLLTFDNMKEVLSKAQEYLKEKRI